MKYPINNYVQAFSALIKEYPDKGEYFAEHFVKLLKKNGDIKHAEKILEAVHRKLVNSEGGDWVTIETARKLSEQKVSSLKHKFTAKDQVDFKINPKLIAGIRVTLNQEKELDNSLNNKLNKLFR